MRMLLVSSVILISINLFCSEIEYIQLSPDRWEGFKNLRLVATAEVSQAIGGSYDDEIKRPDQVYKDLLLEAEQGEYAWLRFAQKDNELIGVVGAICEKRQKTCRHLVKIVSVYVKPEFRKQGIAKQLMDELLTTLRNSGFVKQAMLYVTCSQTDAISLYEKCGFVRCGKLSRAIIIGINEYDQFLMEKSLC